MVLPIAKRVIEKCGGVNQTAELVGNTASMVYRWTYAKDKGGTGGRVPVSAQERLLEASRKGLVDIDPADFFEAPAAERGAA